MFMNVLCCEGLLDLDISCMYGNKDHLAPTGTSSLGNLHCVKPRNPAVARLFYCFFKTPSFVGYLSVSDSGKCQHSKHESTVKSFS